MALQMFACTVTQKLCHGVGNVSRLRNDRPIKRHFESFELNFVEFRKVHKENVDLFSLPESTWVRIYLKLRTSSGNRVTKLEFTGFFRYSYPRYASFGIPASNTLSDDLYIWESIQFPVFALARLIGFNERSNLKIRMIISSGRIKLRVFNSEGRCENIFSLPFSFCLKERNPAPPFSFNWKIKRILIFVQRPGLLLGVAETLLFDGSSLSVAGGQPRSLPRIHCPW